VAAGSDEAKVSLSCEAWKCRAVGTRNEYSREPCERMRGRRDWEERGVETPVWGPVAVVPYMLGGEEGGDGRIRRELFEDETEASSFDASRLLVLKECEHLLVSMLSLNCWM